MNVCETTFSLYPYVKCDECLRYRIEDGVRMCVHGHGHEVLPDHVTGCRLAWKRKDGRRK